MGEAKRKREALVAPRPNRKPESNKHGRKAIREQGLFQEKPRVKGTIVVNGVMYFNDPITGSLRKAGPKLKRILKERQDAEVARLEQEYKEKHS